jgi:hypothetical protein
MTTGAEVTFSVPILSGLLNQDNHVPLFLLNSQLQIQLNLNSVSEALVDTRGAY